MRSSRFINDIKDNRVVTELLRHRRVYLFEYFASTDTMVVYDQELNVQRTIEQYLTAGHGYVLSEDRWQLRELLTGQMHGPLELREKKDGKLIYLEVDALPVEDAQQGGVFAGYAKDVTPEKEKERSLRQQAQHDPMTQLYNRRYLGRYLEGLLKEKAPFYLALLDLDWFKQINDKYGHAFGDQVLVEFARILSRCVAGHGIAVRFGGEEFMLVLSDCSQQRAMELLEQVRQDFLSFSQREKQTNFTFSCGLEYRGQAADLSDLYRAADHKLYQAKRSGRDAVVFFETAPAL